MNYLLDRETLFAAHREIIAPVQNTFNTTVVSNREPARTAKYYA